MCFDEVIFDEMSQILWQQESYSMENSLWLVLKCKIHTRLFQSIDFYSFYKI